MRKMSLVLFAAAAVLLSLAAVNVFAQVFGTHSPGSTYFPDVAVASAGDEHIGWLAESEVTQGFPDGTYHPDDFVTREQMAIYLARLRAVSVIDALLAFDLAFPTTESSRGTTFGAAAGLTPEEVDANWQQLTHGWGQAVALEGEVTLPFAMEGFWELWVLE